MLVGPHIWNLLTFWCCETIDIDHHTIWLHPMLLHKILLGFLLVLSSSTYHNRSIPGNCHTKILSIDCRASQVPHYYDRCQVFTVAIHSHWHIGSGTIDYNRSIVCLNVQLSTLFTKYTISGHKIFIGCRRRTTNHKSIVCSPSEDCRIGPILYDLLRHFTLFPTSDASDQLDADRQELSHVGESDFSLH